jgi:D-glycero-D-manno-heptose 1,7-bisphosphate phosphatase
MQLIILDRDGVINYDSSEFIKSPEEWLPIPGSLEAISQLTQKGFTIAIASNQSGIGRGYFSLETLAAIHQKMLTAITQQGGSIAAIAFCPHLPDDNCECRKPKPGLFYKIADELNADLSQAFVIGDSLRDLQTGWAVNAKTALVLTGNGEKTYAKHINELENVAIYKNLAEAAKTILEKK